MAVISLNTIVKLEVTPLAWKDSQDRAHALDKRNGTTYLVGLRLAVASEIWGSPHAKHCDDLCVGYRKVTLRFLAHDGLTMREIDRIRGDLEERVGRVVQAAMARLDADESEQPSERIAQA